MNFINKIKDRILSLKTKPLILFVEGWNKTIQEAAIALKKENIIEPILLLRNKSELNNKIENIKNFIIDEINLEQYITFLYDLRKNKGLTLEAASELCKQPNYLATILLKINKINGIVCGIEYATKDTLKPALQIIKTSKNNNIVSTLMLLEKKEELLIFADIGMVLEPNNEELCYICENTLDFITNSIGLKNNNVALLSYSTNGSGNGASVDKVKQAYEMFMQRNLYPKENVFGEIQFDAAYSIDIQRKKAPNLNWNNKANVFIFPNLDAGNIGYKIAQRCGGYTATGPIVVGLDKPVNDLSRGANLEEVIALGYITALQSLK